MRKLLILIFCLVLFGSVEAAKRRAEPECPVTGHSTCSDGVDNNHDGIVDEAAPAVAFSAVTGGFAAEIENCQRLSPSVQTTDAGASNSAYVSLPLGNDWAAGQIACSGTSITNGSYFVWLRARVPSAKQALWLQTSAIPHAVTNVNGTVLSQSTVSSWTWIPIGGNANFQSRTNGTTQRSISLNGSIVIYLATEPDIHLDAIFISTDQNATPTAPDPNPAVANFTFLEVGTNVITVDGSCGENAWTNANVVPFAGYNGNSGGVPTVKGLWDNAATDLVYICATITDTNLQHDAVGNDAYSFSDNIVFSWRNSLATTPRDVDTREVQVNIASPPSIADINYPGGAGSFAENLSCTAARSIVGTVNDGVADTSYTIEFKCNLGFDAALDQLVRGDFWYFDKDAGPITWRQAFSTDPLYDISSWGIVKFSSTVVPAPPGDTTAPTYTVCSTINITNTTADGRCTVTEAGSPPVSARIKWGTVSGTYPNNTGTISCINSAICTISITGLPQGTAIFWRMFGPDGAGNNGESAEATFSTSSSPTFYVAHNGLAGNDGTINSPWPTSHIARTTEPKPSAGETWIIKNGTTTGIFLPINCAAGSDSGTATSRITIQAENERQATLKAATAGANAGGILELFNCNFWTWKGIVFEGTEIASTRRKSPVFWINVDNIHFLRNIIYNDNCEPGPSDETIARCDAVFFAWEGGSGNGPRNSLVEDLEILRYGGAALNWYHADNNIFRRVYCNPRDYLPPLTGGFQTGSCADFYHGRDNIMENIFSEATVVVANSAPGANSLGMWLARDTRRNKMLGILSLDGNISAPRAYDSMLASGIMYETTVQDVVLIRRSPWTNASWWHDGIFQLGGAQTIYKNMTIIGFRDRGFYMIPCGALGEPERTQCVNGTLDIPQSFGFTATNIVLINNGIGYLNDGPSHYDLSRTFNFVATFGNAIDFFPDDGNITNRVALSSNPFTNCPAFVSDSTTQLKGQGQGGADIGGNILFAYVNGVLDSTKKLWNSATGAINTAVWGGAVVAGVNDVNALADFHTRLHPNCTSWPSGY